MSIFDHPRYKENPIYLFFERYIQDAIGYLSDEDSQAMQELNLQSVFKTEASEWKEVIQETLHLSETIDIAILDLWYKNREHFKNENGDYDIIWFSQVFTDEYVKEGSKIDIWPADSQEAAKKRIEDTQALEAQQ